MIPRNSTQRKYRPGFEALECKQLLSAGLPSYGAAVLVQATPPASSQVQQVQVSPDGTGKSIRIITS